MKKKSDLKKVQILIVHGWSLDPATQERWQPVIVALRRQGYQVTYLSVPGFDQPLDIKWSLDDYANWLGCQIQQTPNCVVIGHSFGGQIACRTAAAQPQNLRALVLIGPAGVIDRRWHKRLKRSVFHTVASLGKIFSLGKLEHLAKWFIYQLAREKDYYQAPLTLKQTMALVLKDEVISDMSKILVPTLIIWGKQDDYTPFSNARIFNQNIKNSQLYSIYQAEHSPHFTHSTQVIKKICEFIYHVV